MRQHQVMDLLPPGFDSRLLQFWHTSGMLTSKEAGFSIPFGDLGSRLLQFWHTSGMLTSKEAGFSIPFEDLGSRRLHSSIA
jgi:hypothetical protein